MHTYAFDAYVCFCVCLDCKGFIITSIWLTNLSDIKMPYSFISDGNMSDIRQRWGSAKLYSETVYRQVYFLRVQIWRLLSFRPGLAQRAEACSGLQLSLSYSTPISVCAVACCTLVQSPGARLSVALFSTIPQAQRRRNRLHRLASTPPYRLCAQLRRLPPQPLFLPRRSSYFFFTTLPPRKSRHARTQYQHLLSVVRGSRNDTRLLLPSDPTFRPINTCTLALPQQP